MLRYNDESRVDMLLYKSVNFGAKTGLEARDQREATALHTAAAAGNDLVLSPCQLYPVNLTSLSSTLIPESVT